MIRMDLHHQITVCILDRLSGRIWMQFENFIVCRMVLVHGPVFVVAGKKISCILIINSADVKRGVHRGEKLKYKAIFLDNDGILVDTEKFYYRATREILQEIGIKLTEEMYRQLFLVQSRGAWHLAKELGFSDIDVERMRKERNARYLSYLAANDIAIPGVRDVLDCLHQKTILGIVTSAERKHFDFIHAKTGLSGYFDFVLAQGDYVHSKPHPEPYLRALEKSSFAPSECLVIEDSLRGLQSAQSAGLDCWIVPRGLTVGEDFSNAGRLLADLADMLPLVLQS